MSDEQMQSTVIDVGANMGQFCLEVARRGRSRVIAIEPVPALATALAERAREEGLAVEVLELAIALTCERRTFYVAKHADWGVSGLTPFHPQASDDEYWSHRKDLYYDEEISVQTSPMENLLDKLGISVVDFIKIDAQGSDLDVLQSFGPAINRVHAGIVEVASTRFSSLYARSGNTLDAALTYLKANGLEPYLIKQNDPAGNECNVYFCREGTDRREMEHRLQLPGIELYDGRHYWHCPSASPDPPEFVSSERFEALHSEATRLVEEVSVRDAEIVRLNLTIASFEHEVARLEREVDRLNKAHEHLLAEFRAQSSLEIASLEQISRKLEASRARLRIAERDRTRLVSYLFSHARS